MKKLMVAIAAAATALGLYAADTGFVSGTSFDDGDGQTALGINTLEALNAYDGNLWTLNDDSATFEVKNYDAAGEVPSADRPAKWVGLYTQKNFLSVKTALDKVLTRTNEEEMALSTDAFVDTLVKFTACDEEITTLADANAKLAVWAKESEDGSTTNLMVTAGYISTLGGGVIQTNYNCGVIDDLGDWHRLTIKAVGDITAAGKGLPGFVVYIDENPIGSDEPKGIDGYKDILTAVAKLWDNSGIVFPSLAGVQGADISAIAVSGQGGIDDITFTRTAPEFAATAIATVAGVPCANIADLLSAIDEAEAGAEVILYQNITTDLTFAKNATLSLNGCTLTGGIAVSAGSLAINGTGKVTGAVEGDITINGGTFDGEIAPGDNMLINDGLFAESVCDPSILNDYVKPGYELTLNAEETYYQVTEKKPVEDGTAEHPWLINGKDDLIGEASKIKLGADSVGQHYKLMADIDATQGLNPWPGIGTYNVDPAQGEAFKGIFDGNGKKISGLIMKNNGAGKNNYRGFFNQLVDAVVSNLTVECNGFESGITGEYGCAAIAGHAARTVIENCVSEGTISASTHNAGGILIRSRGATIKNCTNKANITGNYTKVAGICVLTQNEAGTEKSLIEGCVNKGTITCASGETAGRDGCAGILAYIGNANVTTIKNCSNEGNIVKGTGAAASVALGQIVGYHYTQIAIDGTNTGLPGVPFVGKVEGTKNSDGLCFATVADDVATGVKNAALAKDGQMTYKVMAPGAAVTLAKGQSIKLDTSLVACVPTTTETGYKVVPDGATQPITYSLEAETYTITYTWTGVEAGDVSKIVNPNTVTSYTVESDTITFSAPSCDGYTFNNDLAPTSIAKGSTGNKTVTGSFEKQSTWPAEWPDADQSVKDNFAAWKTKYGVTTFAGNEAAFLLNVAPGAAKDLVIESITVDGNASTIVVSSEGADLNDVNGVLYVEAGDTLDAMTGMTVDVTPSAEVKASITVAKPFVKAVIGFKAPAEKPE